MTISGMQKVEQNGLKIVYVDINNLIPFENNPRTATKEQIEQIKKSVTEFGTVIPLLVNSAKGRKNVVIGGNLRLKVLKELGIKTIPVTYIPISDLEKEKELNIRLNKNTGDWDLDLLAKFDENLLSDIGFTSEELDEIFETEENPEEFDLQKELDKLNIKDIKYKKGDIYKLGDHRLMCGDSTVEEDILQLMDSELADLCLTDPPYILDYLRGKKKHGKATEGFGYKRDRRYLETDVLPENFTELWMANIHKVAKEDFSIIVYENWKNLRIIWGELEKYFKVKNMIVWRLPNRNQAFAAKYKFFSKHDVAMVGVSGDKKLNTEAEEELLQNEYETALYAISGKPHWEGYEKGKKIQPTDFIDYKSADEKSSGQGIIFGTKPIEILIPYIKVLTQRGELIIEPFGGSGSTMIAAEKLKRRCYVIEKSPVYCEVIKNRWEKLTGKKGEKIYGT